jgi:hypothetical protein
MTDVLEMSAFKFSRPVAVLILAKPHNSALQFEAATLQLQALSLHTPCESISSVLATISISVRPKTSAADHSKV